MTTTNNTNTNISVESTSIPATSAPSAFDAVAAKYAAKFADARASLVEALDKYNAALDAKVDALTMAKVQDAISDAKKTYADTQTAYVFDCGEVAENFFRHVCQVGTVEVPRIATDSKTGKKSLHGSTAQRIDLLKAIEREDLLEAKADIERLGNVCRRYINKELASEKGVSLTTITDLFNRLTVERLDCPAMRRQDSRALIQLLGGQGKAIATVKEITTSRAAGCILDVLHARIKEISIKVEEKEKKQA